MAGPASIDFGGLKIKEEKVKDTLGIFDAFRLLLSTDGLIAMLVTHLTHASLGAGFARAAPARQPSL